MAAWAARDVPPLGCVLISESATTPSLTRVGYRLLLPINLASADTHGSVTSAVVAASRLLARSPSSVFGSVDHSDFVAFTSTRVPSLFTAIESDLRTRARICRRGESLSSGSTSENVLSTGVRKRGWGETNRHLESAAAVQLRKG